MDDLGIMGVLLPNSYSNKGQITYTNSISIQILYFKYKIYAGFPRETTLMFNEIYLRISVTEGLCTNILDVSKIFTNKPTIKSPFSLTNGQ